MRLNDPEVPFEPSDKERFTDIANRGAKMNTSVYIGSMVIAEAFDRMLRQRNLIYGLTYKLTVTKLITKLFFVPSMTVGILEKLYIAPVLLPQLQGISDKYDFRSRPFEDVFHRYIRGLKEKGVLK
jgi:hypothetical protein